MDACSIRSSAKSILQYPRKHKKSKVVRRGCPRRMRIMYWISSMFYINNRNCDGTEIGPDTMTETNTYIFEHYLLVIIQLDT